MIGRRLISVAGLVAVVTGMSGFVSSDPPTGPVHRASLTIEVPEQVEASSPIQLRIIGVDPGADIGLTVDGGYGPRRFTVAPTGDDVDFVVPAADRPGSGQILISATQPGRFGMRSLELMPGPPADPLTSYLGPRTIVADGEHHAMIVSVPVDTLGNPVAKGTSVDYRITRPGGAFEELVTTTSDLLSSQVIVSDTIAGTTRVAAVAGGAAGPEQELLETAGTPVPFDIEVPGAIPAADGRSIITIRTAELLDRHGNTSPDGILVYLDLAGVTGSRRVYGATIDGVAEFRVEVPTEPGTARAIGITSGVVSEPLTIEFGPAVDSFPVAVRTVDDGRLVRIGPVQMVAGAYVPDATTATIHAGDFQSEVLLRSGSGSLVVPGEVSEPISVKVLGAEVRAT